MPSVPKYYVYPGNSPDGHPCGSSVQFEENTQAALETIIDQLADMSNHQCKWHHASHYLDNDNPQMNRTDYIFGSHLATNDSMEEEASEE